MRYELNIQELKNHINDWVTEFISPSFNFRERQFETIVDICKNILEGVNHTQILEAPTGSGKSLLNIISAGVLAKYYEQNSYILVSDLYLWKQYEDFIKQHPRLKEDFGILKGQTGNYTCSKNGEDMRNADCRMANVSWAKLFSSAQANELGYDCASSCPYVKERKRAMKARVVIMTYQLYHYMINIVSEKQGSNTSFKRRNIIFCDECHNIPKIMTSCFTPELKLSDLKHFQKLYSYSGSFQLGLFDETPEITNDYKLINREISEQEVIDRYNRLFTVLSNLNSPSNLVEDAISEYHELFEMFADTVKCIEANLSYKKHVLKQGFSKDEVQLYKSCSWYRNCSCLWSDFYACIYEIGGEYVVRNAAESRNLKEVVVTFTCVKEDYVVWRFLLNTADNRVLMSATLGGIDAFSENIGVKYLEKEFKNDDEEILYRIIPSTFDFSKSPIYFLNRYKMSYRDKSASLPYLKQIIYKICSKNFVGKRGMIQTGSYANAKEIYDSAPIDVKNRMLLYNNAKEKTAMITKHQMSEDTILIGPTLVEGIDLPGDQCRFIIILKVPYPVIVDDYVKKKIELFPLWYNSTTSNIIIQGIGRGNRFKDDYCTTYILDACFLALYNSTKDQYPIELQQRIKMYN